MIEHEATGERRRLLGGRLLIGRGQGCDWILPETGPASLSRRHCLIESAADGFTVRDLGSTNGTRRNGVPVPKDAAVQLSDGDTLELGRQRLRLVFEGGGAARPGPVIAAAPSLDSILAELAGEAAPVRSAGDPVPASGSAATLEEDPLGGFAEELAGAAVRVVPPPREVGPSRGDHAAPQHESFVLTPSPPRPAAPVVPGAEEALRAFLEGAGLSAHELSADDPERFLREAGATFAAMAEGLRRLLATRALVKAHARLERTTIGTALNNPLKYARSRHGAVEALLGRTEPGDLPPVAAVEAAVRDLQAHETGLLEAVEAALEALLGRLDPAVLEERLAREPALKVLLEGGRRARLWQLYRERWNELSEQARRRFMGDLDDAFRAAYERRRAAVPEAEEDEPR